MGFYAKRRFIFLDHYFTSRRTGEIGAYNDDVWRETVVVHDSSFIVYVESICPQNNAIVVAGKLHKKNLRNEKIDLIERKIF